MHEIILRDAVFANVFDSVCADPSEGRIDRATAIATKNIARIACASQGHPPANTIDECRLSHHLGRVGA